LLVDIGPGEFGRFSCDGTGTNPQQGHVTLRGSGREQTILEDEVAAIDIKDCATLSFLDLGAHASRYAVRWSGSEGGSSSWSNVDLVSIPTTTGAHSGWYDSGCTGQTSRSVHYFHGSRIRTIGGPSSGYMVPFYSGCAESWIFGGEILLDLSEGTASFLTPTVVRLEGGFAEVFGTAIRGRITGTGSVLTSEVVGVGVSGPSAAFPHAMPGVFHSHGANIGLSTNNATATNINAVAISAQGSVTVHSPGTAYALSPGASASATRVRITGGTPHIEAPYQWSAATLPPSVTSVNGEDLFVETDCSTSSCTGGTEPHLMIYAPTRCTSSGNPWWDVGRNACRVP
jgi:hypothetical protein